MKRIGFFSTIIILLVLLGCNRIGQKECECRNNNNFFKSLIERPVGTTSLCISLPPTYKLTKADAFDFVIYYIDPIDTLFPSAFSGGIYLGNFPSKFPKENNCFEFTLHKYLLQNLTKWDASYSKYNYYIQTIVSNNKTSGWNNEVHVWGKASSKNDLEKLFCIFSTLKNRK
jgi:hypothetical protein